MAVSFGAGAVSLMDTFAKVLRDLRGASYVSQLSGMVDQPINAPFISRKVSSSLRGLRDQRVKDGLCIHSFSFLLQSCAVNCKTPPALDGAAFEDVLENLEMRWLGRLDSNQG
ncbi:hypothetical protein HFO97_02255 [Rhizobium leguminosarum]|uniref:hypothetical protein n=1 Tax=Rhizobium leguminosarum TaxID=384 RepID=UPI001C955EB8|nr:hypothetical protein [Rhizobium leguminosarum]MBY5358823.1 hypothetical protein [Rhizobium leguminosarum]